MTHKTPLLLNAALAVAVIALLPALVTPFTLYQTTIFAVMSILALSLGFIWGFGGIMSFGQTAFFGLGSYSYAIAAINFGDSTGALLTAIAVPSAFAAILGYFLFYGRISDVYFGIITLTVALILFSVVNSTAGDIWHIGKAALGGFNGIPGVPGINVPGQPSQVVGLWASWFISAGALLLVYLLLRLLLTTRFGRIVVAIKENETRAGLLGFDARRYKLATFIIGAAIAGLAGALYANWAGFISPTLFALSLSAEIIIWVTVGGLGTLVGPIIGCFLIQALVASIGSQQSFNANLVLGAILIVFVLLLPKGLAPMLRYLWRKRTASIAIAIRSILGRKGVKTT